MRFVYAFLIICLCASNWAFSQQISVDNSVGLQQLIESSFESGCVDITNVTSSVNGNTHGLPSYGYFDSSGSSFSLENGVILSTGNAISAGNATISNTLSETATLWGTDPDIETVLGISNTTNATSIEFDIVSAYNVLEFNYIFASEEYVEENACSSQDSFVILIRETSSAGPYQNIALVPGTASPVMVSNIREEINPISCPAQNNQYFDLSAINNGDTNFEGRSTILNASTNIIPQTTYHVKLIIADQPDGTFDSAVFIQSNVFNSQIDLGADITTCNDSAYLSVNNVSLATYEWYYNNSATPIVGATNSNYTALQNGNYRVVSTLLLNGQPCTEEDDVNVTLNDEPALTQPIPFSLCDDPNNGIGEETFILSQHETAVENISSFANPTITYHTSNLDARDLNSNGITTANNLTTPIIYVRLYDTVDDCYAYTSFSLIVNPLPNVTSPANLSVCDENGDRDGFTIIDLSVLDAEITNNQSNLVVIYYDPSNNLIPDKTNYINSDPNGETLSASVIDINTGCVTTSIPVTFDMFLAPEIDPDLPPVFLDGCGSASFDLTDAINDIVGSLTNYTPYFYENLGDAEAGNSNFIVDPENHEITILDADGLGDQVIYLRIESNTPPNCATVVPFEIHTNLLLTGTDLGDFAICDSDNDDSNSELFFLSGVSTRISNDLPNPVTVTFYESEDDRTNDIPYLGATYPVNGSATLFVRLDDGNCVEVSEITLRVNPPLVFPTLLPQSICDTDSDGIVDIDLHLFDNIVTGGNINFSVTYFPTLSDAQTNNTSNQLTIYTNATGTINVHARIESTINGITCHEVSSFDINILSAYNTTQPNTTPICDVTDGNPNGISNFNLNSVIAELTSNIINTSGLNIQFYTTQAAAVTGDANSTNPDWVPDTQWNTFLTSTREVFVRVENTLTTADCNPYSIESFFIYVNTLPIIDSSLELRVCKDIGSNDPDVILADYDELILNGQTDKEVFYFYDSGFTNPIPKDTAIPSFNGNIFIRVENITDPTGCFSTAMLPLVISNNPIFNPITPLSVCESDVNGFFIFDLEEKIAEIRANSPDILNITFHLEESNAENNIQDITNQLSYTGENNDILYIRIERDDTKCAVVEDIPLFVFTIPETTNTTDYNQCDYDSNPDGVETTFDLTIVEGTYFEVIDRFGTANITTHYFRDYDDINQDNPLDNTNAIPNTQLSNFYSETTTIFIKVVNTITECFIILPLNLNVVPPPLFTQNLVVPECYNNTNIYDLTQVNNLLVSDPSNYNISYSTSDSGVSINTNIFNYNIEGNYTIDATIEDTVSPNCISSTSFILQINQNPIANTPPDIVECDDDYDDILQIDLTQNNNIILGLQNASDYSIYFYNTDITDAENDTNRINNNHLSINGETIYARIENDNTSCYNITQFNVRINPLPIIPLNTIEPLCNDEPTVFSAETGVIGDTYLWSTGETTSEILVNPSDVGDYSVTVTRPNVIGNDCPYTHNFTIIPSDKAIIDFTPTVDFADPNSITVEIDPSRIGDYVYILDEDEGGLPQTSNIFDNVTFGEHTVTVRDLNGCMDILKNVFVFDIPKFVTPNNDSTFDTWHIVGANQLPGTVVYIYNRYGKLLKTLPHNSTGWDGTFNGQNMPADDYWFSADIVQNGESFNIRGHFALKR